MAAYLNGLDAAETDAFTQALLHSGRVFDWRPLATADKHSTGGVGDKISLILAPLVAACGVAVPMVSGRGLGHTGGTLDKLESIPGFRTTLDPDAMRAQLESVGVVMVGQGPDLAPADGRLYALRDVTATVERDYFIVPSIVSKKIAEGAQSLVYDVKCGTGAFMETREKARALAERLVATTRSLGARATAFVTDMNWPIGVEVGNASEVRESWRVLHGERVAGTRELTLTLAAEMVALAGGEAARAGARERVTKALDGGAALRTFEAMVKAQGGDLAALASDRLHAPAITTDVPAERDGHLASCDARELGEILVSLGGGRRRTDDTIDPSVGLTMLRARGDRVRRGEPIARLLLAREDAEAVKRASACFRIDPQAPALPPADLVLERVD
jgi:pyrimidine-nucleoside phosphorylase